MGRGLTQHYIVYDLDLMTTITYTLSGHYMMSVLSTPYGLSNCIPILNENCPIHLIHLGAKKDPIPSISYSHIPLRNNRAASAPPSRNTDQSVLSWD